MGLYGTHVLPRFIDLTMGTRAVRAERARSVPSAEGLVLEVGVGSGHNIPFYGAAVRRLYALDPSRRLLRMAQTRIHQTAFPVELLEGSAEAIPLVDGEVDCVVTTWTLCTIPEPVGALIEMRRVLRSGGRLIFVEHGRSPEPRVARWQDSLTPLWRHVAGGCHLNRPIDGLLAESGFDVVELTTGYVAGPRVGTFLYRGIARPAASTPEACLAERLDAGTPSDRRSP
jgi:SAM-dependent methyltransferase